MNTRTTITTKPVGVNCNAKKPSVVGAIYSAPGGDDKCPGVMFRATLSRIEEGLGQEGYMCSHCGRRVKYVPKDQP